MSDKTTAWSDYLAAAQRLDAVRRDAESAAAAESEAVAVARGELPGLQARLTIQAGRLLEAALRAGISPPPLVPTAAEEHAASQAVAGGPQVTLTALRQARSEVEIADGALSRLHEPEPGYTVKNLLVYGPAGLLAMLVPFVFWLLAGPDVSDFYAIASTLTASALLFGVSWLLVGVLAGRRAKTPVVGALTCFAPALLTALILFVL